MRLFITGVIFVVMTASIGFAGEDSFDTEKMLSDIETSLRLSKDQLDRLKPTIDAKSKELKKTIKDSVDNGFVQIEEMGQALDDVSRDTEKKLRSLLNSEEIQKLKEYLGKIDKDAIKKTQEKLVAELTEVLELTDAQIEELKPVLKDSMAKINGVIEELAKEGNKNWDTFKKQYGELSRDLKDKLQDSLDAEQMKKLEKYNKEKKEKIQQTIFV